MGWRDPQAHGGMCLFSRGHWIQRSHSASRHFLSIVASDPTALTKHTRFLELRWPTLTTLALCTLLPGCPFNDDYFIWGSSAGAGQLLGAAGAYELSAGGALGAATGG